MNLLSYSLV